MARKSPSNPIATASPKRNGIDDYEVRDALRTLTRAAEIRKDKPMMRAVKAEAKAQIKSVSKVIAPKTRS